MKTRASWVVTVTAVLAAAVVGLVVGFGLVMDGGLTIRAGLALLGCSMITIALSARRQ